MKTLDELINTVDPAWPQLQDCIAKAKNDVVVLPPNYSERDEVLLSIQMTTRSTLGAILYETGGILVDHGWLRILGSGHPKLPRSMPDWNETVTTEWPEEVPYLLVADDVIGGFFAMDSGYLGESGNIFYLAPDTLEFENMGVGYSQFIDGFCFNADLDDYYTPHRWSGWQEDIANLAGDKVMNHVPPLWAKSAIKSEAQRGRSRAPVPIAEAYDLIFFQKEQIADIPDGGVVILRVDD